MPNHAVTHTLTFGERTITISQANAEEAVALSFHGFPIEQTDGKAVIALFVEEASVVADVLTELLEGA